MTVFTTGKTSLVIVHHQGVFPEHFVPTRFESYIADIEVDGRRLELDIWDTAGSEDYDHLRPLSYPYSHVVLICFSIGSPDSLDNVEEKWVPEVLHFCSEPKVPYLIIGCKKDLRGDSRTLETLQRYKLEPVTPEQGQTVADRVGATMYLECSAKTGEGVTEVFEHALRAALLKPSKKKRGGCFSL
ncbi:GTP-binding protein rhoA AltName: Full=Rho1 protein homolog; Flags: Precursor [Serendipita indica DSM 11827]|nr:GTP-binding protein rhoA AltName: Full=Rho1 protein homolog; Flags: Precursor [Serendipita indica DSM 11827]